MRIVFKVLNRTIATFLQLVRRFAVRHLQQEELGHKDGIPDQAVAQRSLSAAGCPAS